MHLVDLTNWMSFTDLQPTATGGVSPVGFPINLGRQRPFLSSADSTNAQPARSPIDYPLGDVVAARFTLYMTDTSSGSSVTGQLIIEGSDSLRDITTTATAAPAAAATTITVQSGKGALFQSSGDNMILLEETDGSGYEWVQVTNVSSDTLTIVRGLLGTTARTFTTACNVSRSARWVAIPTGPSASPTTLTSAATSIGSPTKAAPTSVTLDTRNLNMDNIYWPFVRPRVVVGGSSTPKITGYVDASLRIKPLNQFIGAAGQS